MRNLMTITPRIRRVEHIIAPVATLRTRGEVCSQYAAVSFPSVKGGFAGVVATDDRGFTGTRAWSPPDC